MTAAKKEFDLLWRENGMLKIFYQKNNFFAQSFFVRFVIEIGVTSKCSADFTLC